MLSSLGYRSFEEVKKKIEELMINNILHYLKTGIFINDKPNNYMDAYTIILALTDKGDSMCNKLLTYHNQVLKIIFLNVKMN